MRDEPLLTLSSSYSTEEDVESVVEKCCLSTRLHLEARKAAFKLETTVYDLNHIVGYSHQLADEEAV